MGTPLSDERLEKAPVVKDKRTSLFVLSVSDEVLDKSPHFDSMPGRG